jgi:hypothetical protein
MHAVRAGFQRQVVFRITAEDWPLLEAAAKEHGSQQAAIIAALRALADSGARGRAASEAEPPEPVQNPKADAQPGEQEQGDWWVTLEQLEGILGLEREALKRRIAQSAAETRLGPHGKEARLDQIEIDTQHAAELMGVSVDSARRRARIGQLGAVARSGGYFFPLGSLEVDAEAAAGLLDTDGAAVEAMVEQGELMATTGSGREPKFAVLDVISRID